MVNLAELDGLPPLSRLVYLVGNLAPEGSLTGYIPFPTLAQRTGITEAEIPWLLYPIPPEKALCLPRLRMAYFRERTRQDCPGRKQISGAVNRLVDLDPGLVALWVHDNEGRLEGHLDIQARLIPLLPEDKGGSGDAPAWLTIAEYTLREALEVREAIKASGMSPEASSSPGERQSKGAEAIYPINTLSLSLRERVERRGELRSGGRGVPYPPEIKAQARELWERETTPLTARQIGEKLGVRWQTILNWSWIEGWKPKRNRGRSGRDWPALKAQVLELSARGLTLAEITRETGVSYASVVRWLHEVPRGEARKSENAQKT